MLDPCGLADAPGWPLRNLLHLLAAKWGLERAAVLCYRNRLRRLDPADDAAAAAADDDDDTGDGDDTSFVLHISFNEPLDAAAASGWELNAAGRPGPRQMNLSAQMDPLKLAEASVDLNVKLMRWRSIPSLDTGMLAVRRLLPRAL
jgi:ubiquitin-like modifier-activating enzyme ATG7